MAESLIKISDVHPAIDGEYPIDLSGFTNRDFHDIKRIANVRSQELSEAFGKGDTDLFVAFAVIALRHAGKPAVDDALWDAEIGKITFVAGDEEETDDLPPALAPSSEMQNEHGGGSEQSEKKPSSGQDSRGVTDEPENGQSPTGTQPLVIGAMSPFPTSVN
jgi:hypothetical protein